MADIKISALPTASSVTDADIVVINQSGTTKTATRALIRGTVTSGTVTSVTGGTGLTGGTITSSGTLAVSYGSTVGTAAQGNDSRLSDARTPTAHKSTHATGGSDALSPSDINAAASSVTISAGTGLTGGGNLTANRTLAVSYGTAAGTAAEGNDSRLSDARTPLTHASSHFTGGSDALTPSDIGAVSTSRTISAGTGLTGGGDLTANRTLAVSYGTTTGTAAQGNDTRLSDARTPLVHASTHAAGGSDQITSLALTTGTITTTPGSANDIVNKAYADSIGSGVNFHDAVDYATLAVLSPSANYNQPGGAGVGVNATLTGSTNVALEVDGVTVSVGKRILVKNQTSQFQNGIYTVTQQGDGSTQPYILTRATDYDTSGSAPNEVQAGDFVLVLNSTLANTAWVQQTPAPINFGVSNIVFIQFAAAASAVSSFKTDMSGLTPSSNTTGAVTLSGTLGIANGGTGTTTQQAAINALAGSQTAASYLRGNGTNVLMSAIQASDVPTLNQNTTGTASNVTGTVAVANGGTGATTQVSAITTLTGTQVAGRYLRSDGTNASLSAIEAADVPTLNQNTTGTASNVTGTVAINNGGTGQTTQAAAITALTGTQVSGRYLRSDGTNASLSAIQAADVPTLNQNTTGTAAGLSTTLATTSGGTGQTAYTDGQILIGNSSTGGLSKATITAGSNVTVTNGNGTITIAATGGSSAGVSSFSAGTTGLTPATGSTGDITLAGTLAIANGGTGAVNGTDALAALGSAIFPVAVRQPANITPASFTATTMTYAAGAGIAGTPAIDGYTLAQGDVVLFVNQTTTNQSGPWVITTIGTASVGAVLTRPSWFTTGTAKSGTLCLVQYGTSNTGFVMSISGPLNSGAGIIIGTSAITVSQIWGRATLATTGGNTFTAKQTFAAGSTTGAPAAFQAGVVLTTPTAHSVEWDGTSMYLTSAAAARRKVAFTDETITLIPTALSGNSTYNYDVNTQQVVYWQTAATATNTLTLNARGSSTATLSSILAVGQSITIGALVTSGTLITTLALQIDGVAVSGIKWQNGLSSGSVNSTDVYTFTITKTAATPTYTVFGSITKYV